MEESSFRLILLVALVILSLMLGVFGLYAHTIMPGLKGVDDSTFVKSFSAIDRKIINPIFMLQVFSPLAILAVALFINSKNQYVEAVWLWVAFASYLLAIVLTVSINVPLNDGIKAVKENADSGALTQARQAFSESRWVISNIFRTLLTLISVVATAVSLK